MFADYFQLFAQKLGIELVPVVSETWEQALEKVQTGACDLLSGVVRTPEREAYLDFTVPYFNVTQVLVAKSDKSFVSGLKALSDKRIGVIQEAAVAEFLRRDFPGLQLVYAQPAEMEKLLEKGRIYAFVSPLERAVDYISERLYQYKIIAKLDYRYPVSVGVHKGRPQLLNLMEHAVASLSQAEHNAINRRWMHYTIREKVDYTMLWQVGGMALLVLGIVGYGYVKLALSYQELRRYFEQPLIGMSSVTRDHRIVRVNRRFCEMLGYRAEELLQIENWHQLIHPEDRAANHDHLEQALRGEIDSYHTEKRYLHKDGHTVHAHLAVNSVYSPRGNTAYCIVMSLDVSERKRAELELIRARQAADAANQAKSTFLANMSHELRTPLNAILGFAQILEHDPQLNKRQQKHVEHIRQGGQYLLTLLNDILDLAKVEAGHIELFPEEVALTAFFQELGEIFRFRAEKKGIAFEYRIEKALPKRIEIDPKRLRQIVMNLLGNAMKFTEQGKVGLYADFHDGQLVLRVEDTGPGIAPQHHAEIFLPFSQLGDNHQKAQGTGLGLSITRKIVELMNGDIHLDSQPGQGSCFHVQLPVSATLDEISATVSELPAESEIIGYRWAQAYTPLRILVVDDIADNRKVLALMLQALGFGIEQVDSGETCLQLAPAWQPHLVFMDMRMPGLDGHETTRRLHALPGLENVPVIMVSASAFEDDREKARAAGCLDYMAKPIARANVLHLLQTHLPLEWVYAEASLEPLPHSDPKLSAEHEEKLRYFLKYGNVSALTDYLENLARQPDRPEEVVKLLELANDFRLHEIKQRLDERKCI